MRELFRVIAPGGRMYLQVPLLHGVTAPPTEPEFHADNTPVFWRFGWDLTDLLRDAGFATTVLVTDEFDQLLRGELDEPDPHGDIFDVDSIARRRPGGRSHRDRRRRPITPDGLRAGVPLRHLGVSPPLN